MYEFENVCRTGKIKFFFLYIRILKRIYRSKKITEDNAVYPTNVLSNNRFQS